MGGQNFSFPALFVSYRELLLMQVLASHFKINGKGNTKTREHATYCCWIFMGKFSRVPAETMAASKSLSERANFSLIHSKSEPTFYIVKNRMANSSWGRDKPRDEHRWSCCFLIWITLCLRRVCCYLQHSGDRLYICALSLSNCCEIAIKAVAFVSKLDYLKLAASCDTS